MTREEFTSKLHIGDNINDAEEEIFALFSQRIPSQNLGFVDAHATSLELTVGGRDFTIHQSPTILASNRTAGTTGAVLWKITPLIAEWMALETNLLRANGILTANSAVLELGCGISGLIGLCLAPHIRKYIATDQPYVFKILKENIEANVLRENSQTHPKARGRHRAADKNVNGSIQPIALDWELDDTSRLPSLIDDVGKNVNSGLDLIIACDCIYNDSLIVPLAQTCAELCRLRNADPEQRPTICLIAQQLRSAEVLESWLRETMKWFDVWRVSDEHLIPGLREDSGFVVHLAMLKSLGSSIGRADHSSEGSNLQLPSAR